ncbi:MAG TPA: MFS transporter [Bryobacteraceae bacterium]|nr:MFS transporter [Bryobacteraceae bacterium]
MTPAIARPAASRVRWTICGLLFAATVIAYVDRGVLAYLEKTLEGIIGWDKEQYSYMTAAFQAAYAIGLVGAGWLTDRLGTRRGFALAITLWSVAAMAPAAASSVFTFAVAMFLLGLGEAANFPACIKTVAEWFPKNERALATGLFNSGANIGAITVPVAVPFLYEALGWRGAFIATGALGFVWLAFWLGLYDRPEHHKRVSAAELAHIQSDPPEVLGRVPWARIIPHRETWAFALAKMLTDPIWWFYIFWIPRYLQGPPFNLSLTASRTPVVAIYVISCVGGIAGGWLSSAMIKSGKSVNAARKTAMLICALLVVPVALVPQVGSVWAVVALVGLAAAAHQGWSANVFTLASDMFPKAAVASVVGFGGMIGSAAGVLFQLLAGRLSYVLLYAMAGSAYVIALVIVHLLTPRMAPAKLG